MAVPAITARAARLILLLVLLAAPSAAAAAAPPHAATIAAGSEHTCAVQAGGSVSCWGSNAWGALGPLTTLGRVASSTVPIGVSNPEGVGPLTEIASIAAGSDHSCAVSDDGRVICWGRDDHGQAGDADPTTVVAPRPLVVEGIADARLVAAGARHSCALRATGGVLCWGARDRGQLGDGAVSATPAQRPLAVRTLGDAVAVAAGTEHSCALRATGGVACWGSNEGGQLGTSPSGAGRQSPTPTAVPGVSDAVALSAGDQSSCALRATGSVVCWGQLAAGAPPQTPAAVAGVTDGVALAAGAAHRCVVRRSGAVSCWGAGERGQLGDGRPVAARPSPSETAITSAAVAVAAGAEHSCALLDSGELRCWGSNAAGQTGSGRTGSSATPVPVPGLSGTGELAAGGAHSCAVQAGAATCWGAGGDGQLGGGDLGDAAAPTAVRGLSSGVAALSASAVHTCALLRSGGVRCWGSNEFGALGSGQSGAGRRSAVPVQAGSLSDAVAIGTGLLHSCALRSGGSVSCWGRSATGQLGPGGTSSAPAAVSGLSSAIGLAVGALHSCAVRRDQTVACWGDNGSGQLGLSDSLPFQAQPTAVAGLTGVTAVAAGEGHSCALRSDGTVRCWGAGDRGQLGQGAATSTWRHVVVSGLRDAVAIAAGAAHSCALRATGAVVCWGEGESGRLGAVSTMSVAPVAVAGLSGATAIAAGGAHSCAARGAAQPVCWGDGRSGQLGDGAMPIGHAAWQVSPVAVSGRLRFALPWRSSPAPEPGPGPEPQPEPPPGPAPEPPSAPQPTPDPPSPTPAVPIIPGKPLPLTPLSGNPGPPPSVVAARKVRRAAVAKGLRFRVLAGKPGSVYRGVLKVGKRGGKTSGKLDASGSALIALKLPKAQLRKVKRGTKLTLAINVVTPAGPIVKLSRTIVVR